MINKWVGLCVLVFTCSAWQPVALAGFYYNTPVYTDMNGNIIRSSHIYYSADDSVDFRDSNGDDILIYSSGSDISGLALNTEGDLFFGEVTYGPLKVTLKHLHFNIETGSITLDPVSRIVVDSTGGYVDAFMGFDIAINRNDEVFYTHPRYTPLGGGQETRSSIRQLDGGIIYSSDAEIVNVAFDMYDTLWMVIGNSVIRDIDGNVLDTVNSYPNSQFTGLSFDREGSVYFGIEDYGPYTVHLNKIDKDDQSFSLGLVANSSDGNVSTAWNFATAHPKSQIHVLAIGISTQDQFFVLSAKKIEQAFRNIPRIKSTNIEFIDYCGEPNSTDCWSPFDPNIWDNIKIKLLGYTTPDPILRLTTVKPGDTFIFYIGSHGDYQNSGNEIQKQVQDHSTLTPTALAALNAPLVPNTGDELLDLGTSGTGELLDDDFANVFRNHATWDKVNKLFIIDACFGGGFWGEAGPNGDLGDLGTLPKAAIIASASESRFSFLTVDVGSDLSIVLEKILERGASQDFLSFNEITRDLMVNRHEYLQPYTSTSGDFYGYLSALEDFYDIEYLSEFEPVSFKTDDFVLDPLYQVFGPFSGNLIQGDVNNDKVVNLKDALLSLQMLSGKFPADNVFKEADANSDGEIGLSEVFYILNENLQP